MALGTYNGYSGETRERSVHWQKAAYLMGLWTKPTRCEACGETKGVIVGHWETYDEPFALNSEVGLCSICHLWVHCRKKNPAGWTRYVALLKMGFRSSNPMMSFNWDSFMRDWLSQTGTGWENVTDADGDPGILIDIASGATLARIRESRKKNT